jgi:pilus assembly protein Flp/PilA
MTALLNASWKLKIWKDTHGQDLIEYALLGGFLAASYGAVLPDLAASIATVLTKVIAVLATTAGSDTAPGG